MTRRQFLATGAGSLLTAAYPLYVESRFLESSYTQVDMGRKFEAGAKLKIAHLSDLHASTVVPLSMIDNAVTLALAQQPDLILLTGDFISHRDEPDAGEYARSLRRLSSFAPTFAILGNHDGGPWSAEHGGYEDHHWVDRLLRDSDVELIHNGSTVIERVGQKLNLVGVGDMWSEELDASRAFRSIDPHWPSVLMSHNPDSKEKLGGFAWDLMLCGHTHGGQVVLPFLGPRWAPVVDKRFVAGLKAWEGRQIYITRGVGNLFGVRIGCRPEVSVLALQSSSA